MAKIKHRHGFINYQIDDGEIILTLIKVDKNSQKQGIGTMLINELKEIARINKLPITLYAEPTDKTIQLKDLQNFYIKNGFELHPDDVDHKYFIFY